MDNQLYRIVDGKWIPVDSIYAGLSVNDTHDGEATETWLQHLENEETPHER